MQVITQKKVNGKLQKIAVVDRKKRRKVGNRMEAPGNHRMSVEVSIP